MSESAAGFERTRSGKIGKFNFYSVPLIWVEGDDDVVFFGKALRDTCRFEAANGRDECEFLISELIQNSWPYGVIVDGDYVSIEPIKQPHDRVLTLLRYAIENYLFESEPIKSVCQDYAASQDAIQGFDDNYASMLARLENGLMRLIILDALNQMHRTGAKTFPDASNELLHAKTLGLNSERIAFYEKTAETALSGKDIAELTSRVDALLKARGIHKVLRGHFAFGVIRQFLLCTLNREEVSCSIDNRGLLIILSSAVWSNPPTDEHRSLLANLKELVLRVKTAKEGYVPPVQLELERAP